ncbi:hypothetical protein [Maricaulis sp.]|uniref:hypothetical protein n=1 Tax=Maricaulis sp. TaxID=1486257 RepID=UPI00261288DB|nr:hypothetical protein [Maricaulis sp.]
MVSSAQWDDYVLQSIEGKTSAEAIAAETGRELDYVQRRLREGLRAAEWSLAQDMSVSLRRQLILARAAMDKGQGKTADALLRRITLAAKAARDLEGLVALNGRKTNAVEAGRMQVVGDAGDPAAELIARLDRLAAAQDQKSLGASPVDRAADPAALRLERAEE